jgi:hypothetical protein
MVRNHSGSTTWTSSRCIASMRRIDTGLTDGLHPIQQRLACLGRRIFGLHFGAGRRHLTQGLAMHDHAHRFGYLIPDGRLGASAPKEAPLPVMSPLGLR